MFKETTATHVIVDKLKVKQTTTHRQLYGKKYPGGGQTLEQMKERTSKTEKRTTTRPIKLSKTSVKKKDSAEEAKVKKSKGKGKARSPKSREWQKKFVKKVHQRGKKKAKKRKAEEAKAMEEEDEDRPTVEEIKSSKPAATRKGLFIH